MWNKLAELELFSKQWHDFIFFNYDKLMASPAPAENPVYSALCEILKNFSPEGYIAPIDFFNGRQITGWIKYKNDSTPVAARIFMDGEDISGIIEANVRREDVAAAGFGDASCGYIHNLPPWEYRRDFVSICVADAHNGKFAAFRFFSLADSLAEDLFLPLAISFIKQNNFEAATQLWTKVADLQPDNKIILDKGYEAAKLSKNPEILLFFENILVEWSKKYNMEWALAPLFNNEYDHHSACETVLERIYKYHIVPIKDFEFDLVNEAFSEILINKDNIIINILYNNFIDKYITLQNKKKIDFLKERIALIVIDSMHLPFILSVIKILSPLLVDIIIINKTEKNDELIFKYGLEKFNIFYGLSYIELYKICVVDFNFYMINTEIRANVEKLRKIFWAHSYNPQKEAYKYGDLSILQSSTFCMDATHIKCADLDSDNFQYYVNLPASQRFEYAATGPFQFGEYMEKQNKALWLEELEEAIKYKIPKDRPLVFCIEDGLILAGQLKYCVNYISRFCTVIFKPYFNKDEKQLSHLSKAAHIYPDDGYAPNLPRFCADILLCGMLTSSFISALLLGLPVIPYYSRYVINRNTAERDISPCFQMVEAYKKSSAIIALNYLYNNWLHFFDVLKVKEIADAITKPDYIDWYKANIAHIQKAAFGDYQLKGAAKTTAEYIAEFASNGSLGKHCQAFRIKNFSDQANAKTS